jgi:hypothetical protein
VLSLLYRAKTSADPASLGAGQASSSAHGQRSGAELLTKRAQAERIFADLSADGTPPSSAQLATAAGLSPSYARALVAEFHARPPAVLGNGRPAAGATILEADPKAS